MTSENQPEGLPRKLSIPAIINLILYPVFLLVSLNTRPSIRAVFEKNDILAPDLLSLFTYTPLPIYLVAFLLPPGLLILLAYTASPRTNTLLNRIALVGISLVSIIFLIAFNVQLL